MQVAALTKEMFRISASPSDLIRCERAEARLMPLVSPKNGCDIKPEISFVPNLGGQTLDAMRF